MDDNVTPDFVQGEPQIEPNKRYTAALELYFAAIGFDVGFSLRQHISEKNAKRLGQQLFSLIQVQQISQDLFDETAEQLYRYSVTIHFTLGRAYSLLAKALGFETYVDARKALLKGGGTAAVQTTRRGAVELCVFVSSLDDS